MKDRSHTSSVFETKRLIISGLSWSTTQVKHGGREMAARRKVQRMCSAEEEVLNLFLKENNLKLNNEYKNFIFPVTMKNLEFRFCMNKHLLKS